MAQAIFRSHREGERSHDRRNIIPPRHRKDFVVDPAKPETDDRQLPGHGYQDQHKEDDVLAGVVFENEPCTAHSGSRANVDIRGRCGGAPAGFEPIRWP